MPYSGGERGNRNKGGAVVEVEQCEEALEGEERNSSQEVVVDILHVRHHGIRNARARQVGYT
jgi:hypothetical protein